MERKFLDKDSDEIKQVDVSTLEEISDLANQISGKIKHFCGIKRNGEINTTKALNKLCHVMNTYDYDTLCMGEILGSESADGLTLEEAFLVYVSALYNSDGDTFYHKLGTEDDINLVHYTTISEDSF